MADNSNGRQINKDFQDIIHLANAMKSLANVIGSRVDDVVNRENAKKRRGDRDGKEE